MQLIIFLLLKLNGLNLNCAAKPLGALLKLWFILMKALPLVPVAVLHSFKCPLEHSQTGLLNNIQDA